MLMTYVVHRGKRMANRGVWPHDLQKLRHHSPFTTTEPDGLNTEIEDIRDRVAAKLYRVNRTKTAIRE